MTHKKEQLNEDLRRYEIGYLAREDVHSEEIKGLLEGYKAEIIGEGKPRKIRLAYPVKKETSASFGYIQFILDPSLIKDIDQKLKLNQNILRFLIINFIIQEQKPKDEDKKPEAHSSSAKSEEFVPKGSGNKLEIVDNEQLEKKLEEILK